MSFAKMSPAERMKASGLIGLIVVLLFFVVHVMLGAISPKKPTAAVTADTVASTTGVPGPPAPAAGMPAAVPGAAPGTVTEAEAFPKIKRSSKPDSLASKLDMDVPNPWIPITPKKGPNGAPAPAPVAGSVHHPFDDSVDVSPAGRQLPPLGGGFHSFGGDAPAGPLSSAPAAVAVAPKPEPEIRLVGLVAGDQGVATLQVAGRMTIARRGDALADGYRLAAIDPEGVVIRHAGQNVPLRVGGAINEPLPAGK